MAGVSVEGLVYAVQVGPSPWKVMVPQKRDRSSLPEVEPLRRGPQSSMMNR